MSIAGPQKKIFKYLQFKSCMDLCAQGNVPLMKVTACASYIVLVFFVGVFCSLLAPINETVKTIIVLVFFVGIFLYTLDLMLYNEGCK